MKCEKLTVAENFKKRNLCKSSNTFSYQSSDLILLPLKYTELEF